MFTFIESSIFERVLPTYLDDDEYSELQQYLIQNPEAGEVVPGSGGLRKVRGTRAGTGKRDGVRIIYFVRYRPNEFWMLTMYAKAKREKVVGQFANERRRRYVITAQWLERSDNPGNIVQAKVNAESVRPVRRLPFQGIEGCYQHSQG